MISNKDLTNIVVAYQEGKLSEPLLHACFLKLAESVFNHKSYYKPNIDSKPIIKEAADLCVEKTAKFDLTRGKAFNFYTTIIGCYIRQMVRHAKRI